MDLSSPPVRHTLLEDVLALVTGTLMLSLGLALYRHAGLMTGGAPGIAFLLHYWSGWDFGPIFFAVNLPFYWLALRRMGRAFTLKTFAAVALLSLFVELQSQVLGIERLQPLYAAVIGGLLAGTGLLILFRHKASLGGVGIVALYLQDRHGWRAGTVQMAVDGAIVLAALSIVEPQRVLLSVLGAAAMNMVLTVNHRPGRYLGM